MSSLSHPEKYKMVTQTQSELDLACIFIYIAGAEECQF